MRSVMLKSAAMGAVALLVGCTSLRPETTPANTGHPPATVPPTFVLLGELHDNADHHRRRAAALTALIQREPATTVVFEQFARTRDEAVETARRAALPTPLDARVDAVIDAAQLDRKSWQWPLHRPIFEAVIATGVPLRGGNLERDQIRRVVREGDAAWPADLLKLRDLTPWRDDQQAVLRQDIETGHCGAMPAAMLPGMVQAQRARDAALAQAMLSAKAAGARQVVLIAGNGHVRRDVGVPAYLVASGVAPADIEAVGYLEDASDVRPGLYDRVERSPAPDRGDPCAAFKR